MNNIPPTGSLPAHRTSKVVLAAFSAAVLAMPTILAATFTGGSATFTLKKENPTIAGLYSFDDYFDGSASYSHVTAWNYDTENQVNPGNAAYTTTNLFGVDHVVLNDPIRPYGSTPALVDGRSPQVSTLEFDTADFSQANLLAAWSPSNFSLFYVGNTVLGEQIGFTNMTRWNPNSGPGSLINGDFALRYVPSRAVDGKSGLVLASYASGFQPFLFADLANASITFDSINSQLHISGDLLVGEGVAYWDGFSSLGANVGTFEMTASVVPEPSTWAMLAAAALWLMLRKLRRRVI
ncbi:MAG TPA: PEP-CTERM sorting domain-containing protein [Terrimicrobiaceae bacterium]|nr:PEP-CTERM sorting domain-containing protein [Terrimicrobiaceae bacterium]